MQPYGKRQLPSPRLIQRLFASPILVRIDYSRWLKDYNMSSSAMSEWRSVTIP